MNINTKADEVILNYLTDNNPNGDFKHSTIGADNNKIWWVKGYNQCIEDNKDKKYTAEDLINAMKYASEITNNKIKYINDYILSIQS